MLDHLAAGDVVTVTRIDRLARSTSDLFGIVKRIVDAKAQFRSLAEPWADTGTSTGRLMLAVLGGLADVERDLIRTGTAEGRSRAKAQGQQMGRPPALTLRRSKQRPADAARRALRSTNSPAATTSAYPPFAARREQHEKAARRGGPPAYLPLFKSSLVGNVEHPHEDQRAYAQTPAAHMIGRPRPSQEEVQELPKRPEASDDSGHTERPNDRNHGPGKSLAHGRARTCWMNLDCSTCGSSTSFSNGERTPVRQPGPELLPNLVTASAQSEASRHVSFEQET